MFNLSQYLKEKRECVNSWLEDYFQNGKGRVFEAAKFSAMGRGKRVRPILCMAAAEASGGEGLDVLPAACAIELLHTYSLIHDDLPAMDDDNLRRGKPTCHVAFDEATAILAGDALLTLSFTILSEMTTGRSNSSKRILRVIRVLANAAGPEGMIDGQMRDIMSEGMNLGFQELKAMHSLKTGAIIRASVVSGAILVGATEKEIRMLDAYAEKTGLAFQVADDILNVEGDEKKLGKAVGSDAARKKNTFPSLMGLSESKNYAKNLVEKAILSLDMFGDRAEPLRAIAKYVIERKR